MALLNFTTKIAVEKTVGEVQAMLAKAGARKVNLDYADGRPVAVAFLIDTATGQHAFRLPVDAEATWRVLVRQREQRRVEPRFVTKDQAARVAWRIAKDWLEAQLALIEVGMARLDQVMLPYLVGAGGKTVYELFAENRLALPPGREAEA